jgi:membrane associated rhomboid family serine protease
MIPFADDNPTRGTPVITYALIALNVVAFVLGLRLSEQQLFELHVHRGFIPARIAQLTDSRAVVAVPKGELMVRLGPRGLEQVQPFEVLSANRREILFSLISSQFLHGSWAHLIGNMLFLFIFGNNVELRLGHTGFLVFYISGGLAAAGLHWAINSSSVLPTIGASGAVAAVLGAYAVTWPHARIYTFVPLVIIFWVFELPAWLVLGVWFAGQILDGLRVWNMELGGGVAWWAHVGGFLFGAAVMWVMNQRAPLPRRESFFVGMPS